MNVVAVAWDGAAEWRQDVHLGTILAISAIESGYVSMLHHSNYYIRCVVENFVLHVRRLKNTNRSRGVRPASAELIARIDPNLDAWCVAF